METAVLLAGVTALFLQLPGTLHAQSPREAAIVATATQVLQENVSVPMRGIPRALLTNAQAIAIVPNVVKLGFVLAGRRGHGILVVRNQDGSWGNPLFITLTGGSIGWQAGVQSTDVILVFKSRKSVNYALDGQLTLGADAAVAAGPIGRQAAAATDVQLKAEIYSYSRSRGLFAGVSLDGSVLSIDPYANAAFYGTAGIHPQEILAGKTAQTPANVVALQQLLAQHAPAAPNPTAWAETSASGGLSEALDPDSARQQLATAWQQLNARLDGPWRAYLALPAGVTVPGPAPTEAALREVLHRFDTAAGDPRYQVVAQMPEFQLAHNRLRAYAAALTAPPPQTARRTPLPPPPSNDAATQR
jgi:lipid-binding SYLF domain-containing protein